MLLIEVQFLAWNDEAAMFDHDISILVSAHVWSMQIDGFDVQLTRMCSFLLCKRTYTALQRS